MKVRAALPTLKRMMADAGADSRYPRPQVAWQVFRRFAQLPVDCASDGVLFQCGVYEFTGSPMFHFDFVRQFTIEKRGDYDHMQQLHVEFHFLPTPELHSLRFDKWSFDFPTLEEFFRFVEARPEFRAVMERAVVPSDVQIYQEKL